MGGGGSADLLLIPGGIGLFLLGMSLMTEGLRALAGPALRRILARATRSPLRGAVAGMVATAAMQSSSAVTVMAVGFVGAGLMSFPQAIGVIFGANVGTTSTGWIVALIGFQFDLGRAALALLPLGALARLLGRGAWRDGGTALAGFGLVFMGIAALKAGAGGLTGFLTPETLPGDGLLGRLALVAIGAGVTVVTHASSAGVAMALTALAAGAISLGQAAALVIGCDIGTTASALLATVGGSTAMRRTGAAHVVYNLMTGALAFLALPAFLALAARLWPAAPEVALVAFHTGFNAGGALLFLPFAGRFGRLIERLFPERAPPLARRLDPALLRDPDAAADAADATVRDLAESFAAHLVRQHGRAARGHAPKPLPESGAEAVRSALDFAERIRAPAPDSHAAVRQVAALHALDHLDRLARRLGQTERLDAFTADPALADAAARLAGSAADADWRRADAAQAARFDTLRRDLREGRAAYRATTIARAAAGEIDADEAGRRLDAMRWLHRVAYHLWRIAAHLAESGGAGVPGGARLGNASLTVPGADCAAPSGSAAMYDSETDPDAGSAEALRRRMALREAEAARRHEAARLQRERAAAAFMEEFRKGHLAKRELAQIQARVLRAAEAGHFEALALRFPSTLCADGGRAINNALPDWPDTLTGKARDVLELWKRWAKPRGYGLRAVILDFPGGMPGDVGLFITWTPPAA